MNNRTYPYEIYFKSERKDFDLDPLFRSTYEMLSDDWRERAYGETMQLVTRLERLIDIIEHYGEGFEPLSPLNLLKRQALVMFQYLLVLKVRNEREDFIDVDLNREILDVVKRVFFSDDLLCIDSEVNYG